MIEERTKTALNEIGTKLSKILPSFYGKIVFNFFNGKCANFNIEQTIKNVDLNERKEK